MSQPYIGEIRMFGGTFAPVGWAICDGSLISIAANSTLYHLIGTTYGGNGQTTFGLPNLLGRLPIPCRDRAGNPDYVLGQQGGLETVTPQG
jgi:microcystin-dependent protein